jgi:hypothetical protein
VIDENRGLEMVFERSWQVYWWRKIS